MKRILNILFILLSMTLAIMIFFFSSDTGEESGSKSSRVTRLFLSLFVEDFNNLSEEEGRIKYPEEFPQRGYLLNAHTGPLLYVWDSPFSGNLDLPFKSV